jgi:hypothetical protein
VDHYYLDFIGEAKLYDVVVFQSYAHLVDDDLIEVALSASKKRGKWQEPIVNGSFVFTVKQGIPVCYSRS